jgi:hypothetical protein
MANEETEIRKTASRRSIFELKFVRQSGFECSFPLPAPAEQTQRAEGAAVSAESDRVF